MHGDPSAAARTVLVTGATGFVGRALVPQLLARGDRVVAFVRNPDKAARLLGPNVTLVTSFDALPNTARVDAIVNLAGEPIAGGLWTARRRALLLDSRLGVTHALLALLARLEPRPRTWLNASAIGFYGAQSGDTPLDETSPSGRGFQAELCRRWEAAAATAAEYGATVALLRFGVVLGSGGGALPSLARPVRWHAGVPLGNGAQWFSWIHRDDLLALIAFVLDRGDVAGALNATAPNPVRHIELLQSIAAALGRRLLPLAVPAVVLRTALGELAELFVDGQRVLPQRALELGFRFRYETIGAALHALFARGRPAA
jgi:uncharacterized protein (TIGR01777 family)